MSQLNGIVKCKDVKDIAHAYGWIVKKQDMLLNDFQLRDMHAKMDMDIKGIELVKIMHVKIMHTKEIRVNIDMIVDMLKHLNIIICYCSCLFTTF